MKRGLILQSNGQPYVNKHKDKIVRRLSKQIATRQNSEEYYSSVLDTTLINPDPILKKLGKDIEVYEDLKYDSRCKAVIGQRKSAVLKREWDVTGKIQSEIDFHKDYLNKWDMPNIITETLDYFWYGYKPLEIVWDVSTSACPERKTQLLSGFLLIFHGPDRRYFRRRVLLTLMFLLLAIFLQGTLCGCLFRFGGCNSLRCKLRWFCFSPAVRQLMHFENHE